jgi:hypothetical protein
MWNGLSGLPGQILDVKENDELPLDFVLYLSRLFQSQ